MTDGERHIADDEETLERFVLGTLPEDRKRRIEQHVSVCVPCAAAVKRERRIAAGARRLGRDRLKEYIRQHAEEPHERALPWGRILSAAAAVGILVGAGIYYKWLAPAPEQVPVMTEQPTDSHPPQEQPALKQESPRRSEAMSNERAGRADEDARRKTDRLAAQAESGAGEKGIVHADRSAADAPAGKVAPASKVGPASVPVAPPSVYWTDGTPLRDAAISGAAELADKEQTRERALGKEIDVKAKDETQKKAVVSALRQNAANYQVNQLPSASLPRNQQVAQKGALRGVPTRVVQEGDTTTLTLFLDSLVSPDDVRSATVQTVSDDSVVVNLGNQKIGYRLNKKLKTQ